MLRLFRFAALFGLLMLAMPAKAQDGDPATLDWQAVISSQIQAFRDRDAPAALSYAGAAFQEAYTDPQQFYFAIINSGYGPIAESRSHSFGPYKLLTPDQVLQDVKFTGNDQNLYEAVYQLDKEPDGWRVHGVQLMKQPGVGV
ncbi:MAG: DUF4864 domain-containing protein [Devosia nanyangense]|uniref:DUF4864 domain-containing protein n=1 Tax=Devosia nanyangense TaxID=1228055 RepID=A0A933KXD3_9HYPH|nr:DUF4864 domain-containing protein [Devosia nanyangense]